MHAGRYGCRVQTTADSVSDEAELLVRGEYANSSDCRHEHYKLPYEGTGMHGLGAFSTVLLTVIFTISVVFA